MTDDRSEYPAPPWTAAGGNTPPPAPPSPSPPLPAPAVNGGIPFVPSPAGPPAGGSADPAGGIPFEPPGRQRTPEPEPMPIPIPGVVRASEIPQRRIGLWGAAGGGKSTYLAALPIAAMRHPEPWIVGGTDESAVEYLVRSVQRMVNRREFPPATQARDMLSWAFNGPPPQGGIRNLLGRRPADGPEFTLQLQDVPGGYYQTGKIDSEIVSYFAGSEGLIYLFDPIGDADAGLRNFNYFYEMLHAVHRTVREAGGLTGGRLPHHVSVCVTKFDEPEFFKAAVKGNWVTQRQDRSRLPSIPGDQGAGFFEWVCQTYRGGTAAMVQHALATFFRPERVGYYACSAIGFRLNGNGIFDYADFRNTEHRDGKLAIRTEVRPVNVLEPLIDLERRMSGRRR